MKEGATETLWQVERQTGRWASGQRGAKQASWRDGKVGKRGGGGKPCVRIAGENRQPLTSDSNGIQAGLT